MSRANSLKKAVRQIIEHVEKALDEQTTTTPVVIVRPLSLDVERPISQDEVSSNQFKSGEYEKGSGTDLAKVVSPIDPHITLPAPTPFADQSLLLKSAPLMQNLPPTEIIDDWS